MSSPIPPIPTGTETVGQLIVAVPTETETIGGVTSPFAFNPANITWSIGNPALATFTFDNVMTGDASFTGIEAGSTTVTVTDTSTGASFTGDLIVTALPNGTFSISFNWQAPTAPAVKAAAKDSAPPAHSPI